MFQRHGDREIGDGRAVLGQREHFGHARVDRLDVVAGVLGKTVEGYVFARVVDFLPHECADFRIELGVRPFAMRFHRFDEEGLAAREGGRQRIVPGGPERIARPPAARVGSAIETFITNGDGKIVGVGAHLLAQVGIDRDGAFMGRLR